MNEAGEIVEYVNKPMFIAAWVLVFVLATIVGLSKLILFRRTRRKTRRFGIRIGKKAQEQRKRTTTQECSEKEGITND